MVYKPFSHGFQFRQYHQTFATTPTMEEHAVIDGQIGDTLFSFQPRREPLIPFLKTTFHPLIPFLEIIVGIKPKDEARKTRTDIW